MHFKTMQSVTDLATAALNMHTVSSTVTLTVTRSKGLTLSVAIISFSWKKYFFRKWLIWDLIRSL